jgi:hypothetical protein
MTERKLVLVKDLEQRVAEKAALIERLRREDAA